MSTSAAASPQREVRVGLVLYGGVSLAIYIYGVVLEFMRAVQASAGREKNAYLDVLRETSSGISVDIVTGTSAGGINGVFLAKALCNGASTDTLERVRSLWLKAADFANLLKPGRAQPAALLDEGFFEEKLREGLAELDAEAAAARIAGARPKPVVDALDLFVTATDLNGRVIQGQELVESNLGQSIGTREYRKVFQLKFRTKGYNRFLDEDLGYDRNDLSGERNGLLARVCRATSAFPVALRPVKIEREDRIRDMLPPGDRDATFLTDGGVLNNKPFTDCIRAISRRAAFTKVDRMMFYVEPGPETFGGAPAEPVEPSFWEVAAKTTIGIRAYQSTTRDMDEVRERNGRIKWFNAVLNRAEQIIAEAPPDEQGRRVAELPPAEYRSYLGAQPLHQGYEELKVAKLREHMRDANLSPALGLDQVDAKTAAKVKESFGRAFDRVKEAKGLAEFLKAFDVPYRIRETFRMIEITELIYERKKVPEELRATLDGFLKRLWAILEKASNIEWRVWDSGESSDPQGWFAADLRQLKTQLSPDSQQMTEALAGLLERMMQPKPGFLGLKGEFDRLRTVRRDLAREIDDFARKLPPADGGGGGLPSVAAISEQFEYRDMFIYPIEVLADLGERDPIDIVRISPRDASFISANIDDKLAGDALFHFGGFLEERWRANDIMWGRLDAAEIIVRALCQKAGCPPEKTKELTDKVLAEIVNRECPAALQSTKKYWNYLREDYGVGKEGLKDVDASKRADVMVSALQSVRDMATYDEKRSRNSLLKTADKFLGRVLKYALIVAKVLRALHDRDPLTQFALSVAIVVLGAWGAITLAVYVIGRVFDVGWLNLHPGLVGVAAGAVLVAGAMAIVHSLMRRKSKL